MGEALAKRHYTVAEYLEILKDSTERLAFHDGEIFAMAGGSVNHARLSGKIGSLLGSALLKTKCSYYSSDLMIGYSANNYVFADATVICGNPEVWDENKNAIKNPTLIVEVLSPDTEEYDRGLKFYKYRSLETLKEYVLVSQNRPWVEVFFKREGIDIWQYTAYYEFSETIKLQSLDIEVSMQELYDGIF
ncbi:MAG: Uma2 family endonuclease [Spirosomataceae bacterium]